MSTEKRSQLDRRLREGLGEVGKAFFDFPALTEVQRAAIRPVAEGRNVLICAATATGKTEAIIAPLVWRLSNAPAPARSNGPRLLAVAPTRALVADLVARLAMPLAQLGWRCGAQTSDFRGKTAHPEVLVTTPESFDSMIVRDLRREQGEPVGHLLAHVEAVFVDEAHCFDNTARGDQVVYLLARLRRLREYARKRNWTRNSALQVCGASATVRAPDFLAEHLLGHGSEAVVCAGSRPIEILTGTGTWHRLDESTEAVKVASVITTGTDPESVADLVWRGMEAGECRKILIFAPSRKQCDLLSRELRRRLGSRRALWVGAHHGSLSRKERQDSETCFHQNRDSLLVATNTLEVGIDIGDVDCVVLVGAPPDTSSLLQRIGRGGRRAGLTRVVPIARHSADRAALASELMCAVRGDLDANYRLHRWDVFPQQVISYIRQNHGLGRSIDSVVELASTVWPAPNTRSIAEETLRAWVTDGCVVERRGRLQLGPKWDRFAAEADADSSVHSNIRSGGPGIAIRDRFTGEIIGHAAKLSECTRTLTMAGKQHRIVGEDHGITVVPVADPDGDNRDDTPNYAGRRRSVLEAFAAHVRRGLGFHDKQAPFLRMEEGWAWFHFGGEVFEACIKITFPNYVRSDFVPGLALMMDAPFERLNVEPTAQARLQTATSRLTRQHLDAEGAGRFAEFVPAFVWERSEAGSELFTRFQAWIQSRMCSQVGVGSQAAALKGLLLR